MSKDISNTAVVILLVLTILIATIGTWTVLDTARQSNVAKASSTIGNAQATGLAQETPSAPPPGRTELGGRVELTIVQ